MTDHYAVIGNPISHSKSPLIHSEFAKQTGQDLDYIAKEIALDKLADGLKKLQRLGFKGINITVPFKEQVWQLVNNKSDHASRAGAVNTVLFNDDGSLFADNTDGIGLCRDLVDNHHVILKNKRILLLGAGGAARGVIEPLLAYQPTLLHIANRTSSKAVQLAKNFQQFGPIKGSGFEQLSEPFDVIINATAASLHGEIPAISASCVTSGSCCYDMMYSQNDTAFISWAKQNHVAKTSDGLGMLVEQAAEAFYLWRGIKPETKPIIELLRTTK